MQDYIFLSITDWRRQKHPALCALQTKLCPKKADELSEGISGKSEK